MWSVKDLEQSLNFIPEEVFEPCEMQRILHFKAVVNSEITVRNIWSFQFTYTVPI